jgi:hypothetical protein
VNAPSGTQTRWWKEMVRTLGPARNGLQFETASCPKLGRNCPAELREPAQGIPVP